MEGTTAELQFESKRPPGTESMGVVISATAMTIQQNWNPTQASEIAAGDVIVRTITRNADGTTAMMLPPVSTDAPDGVQVYAAAPDVQDKVERGDASAKRIDTIKYQFQRSGRFELPELTFVWWDAKQEKLQSESVAGLEINVIQGSVAAQNMAEEQVRESSIWKILTAGLLVLGFLAWLVRKPLGRCVATWRAHHNRLEAIAARRLRSACTANDAPSAYAALMAWLAARRVVDGEECMRRFLEREEQRPLREHWQTLSNQLFSSESATVAWQGKPLWAAFSQMQRQLNPTFRVPQSSALPALNPTAASSVTTLTPRSVEIE